MESTNNFLEENFNAQNSNIGENQEIENSLMLLSNLIQKEEPITLDNNFSVNSCNHQT